MQEGSKCKVTTLTGAGHLQGTRARGAISWSVKQGPRRGPTWPLGEQGWLLPAGGRTLEAGAVRGKEMLVP